MLLEKQSQYSIGMYRILASYSSGCRIVVGIVQSYSDEQCHQNEYEQLVWSGEVDSHSPKLKAFQSRNDQRTQLKYAFGETVTVFYRDVPNISLIFVTNVRTAGAASKCSGANAIRIRPNSLKPLFGTPLVFCSTVLLQKLMQLQLCHLHKLNRQSWSRLGGGVEQPPPPHSQPPHGLAMHCLEHACFSLAYLREMFLLQRCHNTRSEKKSPLYFNFVNSSLSSINNRVTSTIDNEISAYNVHIFFYVNMHRKLRKPCHLMFPPIDRYTIM